MTTLCVDGEGMTTAVVVGAEVTVLLVVTDGGGDVVVVVVMMGSVLVEDERLVTTDGEVVVDSGALVVAKPGTDEVVDSVETSGGLVHAAVTTASASIAVRRMCFLKII